MQGVCCHCQMVHPVRRNTSRTLFGFEEDNLDREECNDWVMYPHYVYNGSAFSGPLCDGEGTTPQALVPRVLQCG